MASVMEMRDPGPSMDLSRPYKVPGGDLMNPGESAAMREGLSLQQLTSFLQDIEREPQWRKLADKCVDYYDNNQLDSEILALMAERDIPPMIINLVQPAINTVLGMEAKNRRDWRVSFGDDGQSEMVAKAINKKLNTAERESKADRAISQAYAAQIKAGLGWVEVSRNSNPFRNPYRVQYVHRREIWWDWRFQDPEDWRYLVRRKWYDEDHLLEALPEQFAPLIRQACSGWGSAFYLPNVSYMLNSEHTGLADALEREKAFPIADHEWRDTDRKRVVLYEAWYRKWKRGLVFRLPNDKVMVFEKLNPRHMMAYQAGLISPFAATYPEVRQSIWVGPHRLFDRKSPYSHQHFPYVPFFGFREDLAGIPYGLIRVMISPQDEINARRSRLNSLLGSRRVEMDSDALATTINTVEDVAEEVSRADSFVVLNPGRKNANGFQVTDNADLSVQQFQILAESKAEINQVSGLFGPMHGDPRSSQSGIAITSLVEQGTTTLAEINDEYADGRRMVGTLLMSMIVDDSLNPHEVTLGEGKAKTQVFLNKPAGQNQMGDPVKENDVGMANLVLELEDVPSTQTYRQQQFTQLAEMAKALPPQVQQFVIDFVIESTDHPERKKMAKRIRSALGIPEDGVDGEAMEDPAIQQLKAQYEEQIAALSQQLQAAMQELESKEAERAEKAADRDLKSQEINRRADVDMAKVDLARKKMEADELARAAEMEREQDQSFLESLAADANQNGIPDGKELLDSVLADITPTIEKVSGEVEDVAAKVEEVAKSMKEVVDDMRKELAEANKQKFESQQAPLA